MEVISVIAVIFFVLSALSKAAKTNKNRPGMGPKPPEAAAPAETVPEIAPKGAPALSRAPMVTHAAAAAPAQRIALEKAPLAPRVGSLSPAPDAAPLKPRVADAHIEEQTAPRRAARTYAPSARGMRTAIVLSEILAKPVSMRNEP